ncbi:MAG: squalene/phytoene synthase family protein [Gammaproteobacteria bacterium]|nr:squalene/phytoene synthase family protein [Gammaproteobacteria bacterium]
MGHRSSRLLLLARGLFTNRDHPDLESLAAEDDPERFVWRVLPHAARSFAASIVILPAEKARASAVAYLYSRILDTYEDLYPDAEQRSERLDAFAHRFETGLLTRPAAIPNTMARDDRDRLHLLLVDRCDHVDVVYRDVQRSIAGLVRSMADGMMWSTDRFAHQGGVLKNGEQVTRYCRNVIGNPVLFALGLISGTVPTPAAERDAFAVGEMIQLANITRDVEKDLARGIGYHPALKPYLGNVGDATKIRETVQRVRDELVARAMSLVPAYRRLLAGVEQAVAVRTAAVLMLGFTELHYRGCVARSGREPWPGPSGSFQVVLRAIPSLLSVRWARRTIERIETEFLRAAALLQSHSA